jgi:hypothetical protein
MEVLMDRDALRQKIKESLLQSEQVLVPEWGCEVTIRELNGAAYLDITELALDGKAVNKKKFLELAIIHSVYAEGGDPLFDMSDREMVSNLSASVYSVLVSVITRINRIDEAKN